MSLREWMAPAAGLMMLAAPAAAEGWLTGLTYGCDRGVTVPVTYVNATEGSAAVLWVEGRLVTLEIAPSGSGARYVEQGKAGGYVWWNKGEEATLFHGAEETILMSCRQVQG